MVIENFVNINADTSSVIGESGTITTGISDRRTDCKGTPNDITLQGQVPGSAPLPTPTAMEIPADTTKEEAGDASGCPVRGVSGNPLRGLPLIRQ
jgi:hypothetical protein